MELKDTIIKAISEGVKDLSLLDGEQYHPLLFGNVEKAKGISERETLCILYYEFCTPSFFPFVQGRERIELYLNIIKRRINNFVSID